MKNIEVWTEGYAATGQRCGAQYHGTYQASTLKEAVCQCVKAEKLEERFIDYERMTYWGCSFFDNQLDAARSFGL